MLDSARLALHLHLSSLPLLSFTVTTSLLHLIWLVQIPFGHVQFTSVLGCVVYFPSQVLRASFLFNVQKDAGELLLGAVSPTPGSPAVLSTPVLTHTHTHG